MKTSPQLFHAGLLLLLMVAAPGLAVVAAPTARLAEVGPKVDLESMIPSSFGEWAVDTTVVPLLASPETKATLARIYDQTLSRTYSNPRGDRVMLSIAYGGDQRDSLQVHKPEVCYAAQGFAIRDVLAGVAATPWGELPVRRLVAVQGQRTEPITYWITVGDHTVASTIGQKVAQLSYTLTGKVPDGVLFRVSTISPNAGAAYAVQEQFVRDLLAAVDAPARLRLIGH